MAVFYYYAIKGRITIIISRDNTFVKKCISLKTKKGRDKHNLFLAEGPHVLKEVLNSSYDLKGAIIDGENSQTDLEEIINILHTNEINVHEVSSKIFKEISDTDNPQGIIGLVDKKMERGPLPSFVSDFLGIMLHGLQDPGNVGTIIRTAWGAGIDSVFITPGTADPFSGKVVRASQGGIFHSRIYYSTLNDTLVWANNNKINIWFGDPEGKNYYFEENYTNPTLFVVGNEARGFSTDVIATVNTIKIPLPTGAESLNVSISAAILIYEALRQRMSKAKNV